MVSLILSFAYSFLVFLSNFLDTEKNFMYVLLTINCYLQTNYFIDKNLPFAFRAQIFTTCSTDPHMIRVMTTSNRCYSWEMIPNESTDDSLKTANTHAVKLKQEPVLFRSVLNLPKLCHLIVLVRKT